MQTMDSRLYQDANTKFERAGLLENAWEESKTLAMDLLKDPNEAFYMTSNNHGQEYKKSFISNIKLQSRRIKN